MMRSLTSVNVVFMISVSGLYVIPQQLQGYAADDIFDTESIVPAEIVMGLDGKLSAGYIPVPIKQSITLQADSDSNTLFEAWYAAQQAAKEIYFADGLIHLGAIQRSYVMRNGVLSGYPAIADAKKMLQPRKYAVTWESVLGAPL